MVRRTLQAIVIAICCARVLQTNADDATGRQIAPAELRGRVVDADGKPVAGIRIKGYSLRNADKPIVDAKSDSDGNWKASSPEVPILVGAKSADEKFAALARLEPGTPGLTLRLTPTTTARGKLVDEDGKAVARKQLCYAPTPFITALGGKVVTDNEGNFTLGGLSPEQKYLLSFVWDDGDTSSIQIFLPKKAETLDLANVMTPPTPLSLSQRAAFLFGQLKDLPEKIEQSLKFDGPQSIRLIVVVGDPQSEAARRCAKSFFVGSYPAYEGTYVSIENEAAMSFLRTKYGLDVAQLKPLSLLIFSADEKLVASKHLPWTMSTDEDDLNADVDKFLNTHALPRPDARELLAAAFARARCEGKCVLLDEIGTYCGWCRVLARFFDRHSDIFADHFVLVQIDRDRSPHGYDALNPYRPSGEGGVPWCALIDADGKKLGDWDTADGNMGYPTLPKEFDHLERILKLAAPKITDQQLAEMRADLEQEAKKYNAN
jgi:hypothetical protein